MPVSLPGWSQHRPRWLTFFGRHSRLPQFLQTSSLLLSETASVLGGKPHSFLFFSHPSCCIGIPFFFPHFPFSFCALFPSFEVPRNYRIMMGEGEEKREEKTVTNQSRYTCILTKKSEIDVMLLFAQWKTGERSDVEKEKKRVRGRTRMGLSGCEQHTGIVDTPVLVSVSILFFCLGEKGSLEG